MPVTMDQVRAVLGADEPNYEDAKRLGPEALPFLAQLVLSGSAELASKATSLTGAISGAGSKEILATAARNAHPVVRVAAADAVRNLPSEEASGILIGLVTDADRGVRQIALESLPGELTEDLRARVAQVSERDPVPRIRDLARETLKRTAK